jgi:hypothetical protein
LNVKCFDYDSGINFVAFVTYFFLFGFVKIDQNSKLLDFTVF